MRWFLLSLFICVAMGLEPRCISPRCYLKRRDPDWYRFVVEDYIVEINYKEVASFIQVNCHEFAALDGSPAMPHFTSEFHASNVVLNNCPLPTNVSLVNALEALNVTFQPTNDETSLKIINIPKEAQLVHFVGLEHLTNLSIDSYFPIPEPPAEFFGQFQNLRSLQLRGVTLSAGGLHRLPRTLKTLELNGYSLKIISSRILPEVLTELLSALPDLVTVTLQERVWPDGSHRTAKPTNLTRVLTNATSSLEALTIYLWPEMTVLEQCESLRILDITRSNLTLLPDRFVAACPRLEELSISYNSLKKAPAKLLEGATALKRFFFKSVDIRTLPEGFFQGAPNLIEIDLSYNYLDSFSSDIFLGLPLETLRLRDNLLNDTLKVGKELAKFTSLTELDLAFNKFEDFCDNTGYSPLATLTKLRILNLSYNHKITRICRDWRQNLTFLEDLNVWSNGMTKLKFDDFQFTRDSSVKISNVYLGKLITHFDFTEDDYKKTLMVPEPDFTVVINFNSNGLPIEVVCDCSVYWFRQVLEKARRAINIHGLVCRYERYIYDVKPEEMCPGLATTN